jgi:hypothetical protein
MPSNAFIMIVGFVGIALFGLGYAITDQLVLGDIWNFAIAQQLNGTYLNIYRMMWLLVPVIVVFSFVLGSVVNSHKFKNEM